MGLGIVDLKNCGETSRRLGFYFQYALSMAWLVLLLFSFNQLFHSQYCCKNSCNDSPDPKDQIRLLLTSNISPHESVRVPSSVLFESLLRQYRDHGFTHLGAAAHENVGIFRPRAGAPCLFDGPALPHVLDMTRRTFPGNRLFLRPADNRQVGEVGREGAPWPSGSIGNPGPTSVARRG